MIAYDMACKENEGTSSTTTITEVAIDLTQKGFAGAELNNNPLYDRVKKQTIADVCEAIKRRIEESLKKSNA